MKVTITVDAEEFLETMRYCEDQVIVGACSTYPYWKTHLSRLNSYWFLVKEELANKTTRKETYTNKYLPNNRS